MTVFKPYDFILNHDYFFRYDYFLVANIYLVMTTKKRIVVTISKTVMTNLHRFKDTHD